MTHIELEIWDRQRRGRLARKGKRQAQQSADRRKAQRGGIPKKGSVVFVMDDTELEQWSLASARTFSIKHYMPDKEVHCISYSSFFEDPPSASGETVILDSTRLFEEVADLRDTWAMLGAPMSLASSRQSPADESILRNRERLKKALEAFRQDESFREDGSRSVIMLTLTTGREADFSELLEKGLVDSASIVHAGDDVRTVEDCDRIRQEQK